MVQRQTSATANNQSAVNRRRPLIFLLLALCLLFVASYTSRLAQLRRLQNELAGLNERAAEVEIDGRKLEAALQVAQSDAYVEREAIEHFNMARPDETVLVLTDPSLAAQATAAAPALRDPESVGRGEVGAGDPEQSVPIWRQWLQLFAAGA